MKKGILFDLDGTLWDSTYQITDSWNEVFKRRNIGRALTLKDIRGVMGKTVYGIAAALLPQLSEEDGISVINECFEEEVLFLRQNGGILFPKLGETLTELQRDYTLFIVSNCQDGYIQTFLDVHEMHKYFADFESFGKTQRPKGENIASVMKRNGITKAVFVGDTQSDCEAADFANVPFVHAAYGFGSVDRPCEAAHAFEEISPIVRRLMN